MSLITEVILTAYPLGEGEQAHILNHEFYGEGRAHPQFFRRHDPREAGGSKAASWDVFQAAFNHVALDDILHWFKVLDGLLDKDVCMSMVISSDENEGHPMLVLRGFPALPKICPDPAVHMPATSEEAALMGIQDF